MPCLSSVIGVPRSWRRTFPKYYLTARLRGRCGYDARQMGPSREVADGASLSEACVQRELLSCHSGKRAASPEPAGWGLHQNSSSWACYAEHDMNVFIRMVMMAQVLLVVVVVIVIIIVVVVTLLVVVVVINSCNGKITTTTTKEIKPNNCSES